LRQVAALVEQFALVDGGPDWLRRHRRSSPEELAVQLAAARDLAKTEAAKAKRAGEARAEKAGVFRQAGKAEEKFGAVGVGVPCSLCGQVVTRDHAKRERARLASEVENREKELNDANMEEENAKGAKKKAEDELERLQSLRPLVAQLAPVWRE